MDFDILARIFLPSTSYNTHMLYTHEHASKCIVQLCTNVHVPMKLITKIGPHTCKAPSYDIGSSGNTSWVVTQIP